LPLNAPVGERVEYFVVAFGQSVEFLLDLRGEVAPAARLTPRHEWHRGCPVRVAPIVKHRASKKQRSLE